MSVESGLSVPVVGLESVEQRENARAFLCFWVFGGGALKQPMRANQLRSSTCLVMYCLILTVFGDVPALGYICLHCGYRLSIVKAAIHCRMQSVCHAWWLSCLHIHTRRREMPNLACVWLGNPAVGLLKAVIKTCWKQQSTNLHAVSLQQSLYFDVEL